MDISQLAQELLDKGGQRVSVAVKVCVNKAPHITKKYEEEEDDMEDVDDEPMPAKGKMAAKSDDDEEDVYVEELSDQYEIDMEGKKKPAKR
jgi:hypothetical protein